MAGRPGLGSGPGVGGSEYPSRRRDPGARVSARAHTHTHNHTTLLKMADDGSVHQFDCLNHFLCIHVSDIEVVYHK